MPRTASILLNKKKNPKFMSHPTRHYTFTKFKYIRGFFSSYIGMSDDSKLDTSSKVLWKFEVTR